MIFRLIVALINFVDKFLSFLRVNIDCRLSLLNVFIIQVHFLKLSPQSVVLNVEMRVKVLDNYFGTGHTQFSLLFKDFLFLLVLNYSHFLFILVLSHQFQMIKSPHFSGFSLLFELIKNSSFVHDHGGCG